MKRKMTGYILGAGPGVQKIDMQGRANIKGVGVIGDHAWITLWAEVRDWESEKMKVREFYVFGSGESYDASQLSYLGTVVVSGLPRHIFERV